MKMYVIIKQDDSWQHDGWAFVSLTLYPVAYKFITYHNFKSLNLLLKELRNKKN